MLPKDFFGPLSRLVRGVLTHVYAYTLVDLDSDLCNEIPAKKKKKNSLIQNWNNINAFSSNLIQTKFLIFILFVCICVFPPLSRWTG